MTHAIREFAQALLLAAVDRSHDLSMIQKLMNLVFRKHTEMGKLLRKLVKKAPKEWFRYARGPSIEPKVAEPVRASYARNFRTVFLSVIRGISGSVARCQAFINLDNLVGARIMWS